MCGIVGFTGKMQAAPILLDGLSKLEYRGYDSAGLAVRDGIADVKIVKAKGRLSFLSEKTNGGYSLSGNCGIGHTRWATHGEPSEINAHPHRSDDSNVVAVHNGIIENYQELMDKLLRHGYTFYSQTDTEVLTKLVDYYYKKYKMGPIDAVAKTMVRVRGSYALAVMFKDYPEEIYAARKDSPMIIGMDGDSTYLASDVPAILKYTRSVYYIDNLEMARLNKGAVTFFNLDGDEVPKEPTEITWDAEAAEKGGYQHFMMKEIHEQPKAVAETLHSVENEGRIDLTSVGLTDDEIKEVSQIYIVACGSAYHVGIAAQYVIEDLAGIPVRVELASEFRYRKLILNRNGLVIVISQSGETADTLAALREANKLGVKTLAIVNVVGSSIAREADCVFYTLAGPEIAVATTKAYSTQLIASYLLAIQFGYVRGEIDEEKYSALIIELESLPQKIERILEDKGRLQWFAAKFANAKDIFFIGRGIDYAICMEGSLKMKEISYVHSEAYAAGELKHGTISLIEDGTLVIGVLTQPELYEKTVSNMVEVKSRGAYLMGLVSSGKYEIEDTADFVVYVPKTDEHFTTSLAVIPLQLLGYYVSVAKGLDVDKPRNLAKSVNPMLFNDIAKALPRIHFLWIGDGEMREALTSPNIEITGWLDRKDALSRSVSADVFLLTSLWEGLPISLLEAMYMKKPCVVNDVIGNHDVIHSGVNGYVCQNVSEFAESIENVQCGKSVGLVETAYMDILNKYNTAAMVEKYSAIYDESLRKISG